MGHPPHSHRARPNLRRELEIAERALASGDPAHAAHHAAEAMAHAPRDPAVLEIVDRLIDTPKPGAWAGALRAVGLGRGELAPLFPNDGYVGHVAARARAHERREEWQAAFDLVVQIARHTHDRPVFVLWALALANEARARACTLDPSFYEAGYPDLSRSTLGFLRLRPAERAFFAPWAELGQVLADMNSESAQVRWVVSGIVRRAGLFQEAYDLVRDLGGVPFARVAQGLALRGLERYAEACTAFSDSEDAGAHSMEIARVEFEARRYESARRAFDEANAELRVDDVLWSGEEYLFGEVLDELLDATRPRRFTKLVDVDQGFDDIRRYGSALGVPEPMSDATTNVLSQLKSDPPTSFKMTVSCLESPSVLLTMSLRAFAAPEPWRIDYLHDAVPAPHPFDVLDESAGIRMWNRKETLVEQALDPPPAEVTEAVDALTRELTVRPVEGARPVVPLGRAWRAACAAQVIEPGHLFAAMIYPTRPDDWAESAAWVFHRQLVAAMLLAAQGRDRSWLASPRRESLRALVFGHPDWTQAAALYALREAVLDTPDAVDDVYDWCLRLVDLRPDRGHYVSRWPLALLLGVPGMPFREVDKLYPAEERAGS